jgi:hypothetical protein
MKGFIFLYLLISLNGISQQNKFLHSFDSLNKYSYFLFGSTASIESIRNSIVPTNKQGTGFFVKSDTVIYFITAKHSVVGYGGEMKKEDFPQSLNIYSNDSIKFWLINIPTLWSYSIHKRGYSELDVVSYKINNPPHYINTLQLNEFLIIHSMNLKHFNHIKIFGYPSSGNNV